MPRDALHVTEDLDDLLKAAELPGPYILVGHSLGAQYVRYFAFSHPDQVVSLVLIDPDFRDLDHLVSATSPANAAALAQSNDLTRRCVGSIAAGRPWSELDSAFKACGPPPAKIDAASQAMARATLSEFDNRTRTADEV